MLEPRNKQGFTVIELLITLFIAAAFLVSGYQLFHVVVGDGGEARLQSRASNVSYDYLQRYEESATNPCTTVTPLNNSPTTIEGLSDVFITVDITCPYTGTTSVSKITVSVKYGPEERVITNATYTAP